MIVARRFAVALGAAFSFAVPPAAALERPESATSPEQNYVLFCGGCHGVAGDGVARRVPALKDTLGRFLRVDGGRELLLYFPGVANSQLTDTALAAVMNWCIERFAGADRPAGLRPYTASEVREARANPQLNIQRSRREIMVRAGVPADAAATY